MKPLKERLADQKDTVLQVTNTLGRFRAMHQFHVSDYACFCRWLKEVTGDENFGLNPKISPNGSQTLGDQLVDAFLHKVAQLQAQNEELKGRKDFLEWQLSQSSQKETDQALAILQACEV